MKISNRAGYLIGAAVLITIAVIYENRKKENLIHSSVTSAKEHTESPNEDNGSKSDSITITIDKKIEGDLGLYFKIEQNRIEVKRGEYFVIKLIPIKKGTVERILNTSDIRLVFEKGGYAEIVSHGSSFAIADRLNKAFDAQNPVRLQFSIPESDILHGSELNGWLECDCTISEDTP
ncbi:hypothetical protein [Runella limosa]|uniref:hypothetical protein n=1 Tax=Runella limosa TaxID=370978 RepID=UPI0004902969|nr:hypothetical protein [Runella limosa]